MNEYTFDVWGQVTVKAVSKARAVEELIEQIDPCDWDYSLVDVLEDVHPL